MPREPGHVEAADPSAVPERLRTLPSRLLGQAMILAARISRARLEEAEMDQWRYAVLVTLHAGGAASQAELSERTGVHSSDLVGVLNALAEAGYVERQPDPADRRRNLVSLTRDGARRLQDLNRRVDEAQDDLLAPLGAAERKELVRLLSRIVEHHARQ